LTGVIGLRVSNPTGTQVRDTPDAHSERLSFLVAPPVQVRLAHPRSPDSSARRPVQRRPDRGAHYHRRARRREAHDGDSCPGRAVRPPTDEILAHRQVAWTSRPASSTTVPVTTRRGHQSGSGHTAAHGIRFYYRAARRGGPTAAAASTPTLCAYCGRAPAKRSRDRRDTRPPRNAWPRRRPASR